MMTINVTALKIVVSVVYHGKSLWWEKYYGRKISSKPVAGNIFQWKWAEKY